MAENLINTAGIFSVSQKQENDRTITPNAVADLQKQILDAPSLF